MVSKAWAKRESEQNAQALHDPRLNWESCAHSDDVRSALSSSKDFMINCFPLFFRQSTVPIVAPTRIPIQGKSRSESSQIPGPIQKHLHRLPQEQPKQRVRRFIFSSIICFRQPECTPANPWLLAANRHPGCNTRITSTCNKGRLLLTSNVGKVCRRPEAWRWRVSRQ